MNVGFGLSLSSFITKLDHFKIIWKMSHGSQGLTFPLGKTNDNFPSAVKTMLERGEDPKEMMIEICKPSCTFWEEKLKRCEATLRTTGASDPEMTCMYPMRDWVTCVEACVQNTKGWIQKEKGIFENQWFLLFWSVLVSERP